MEMHTLKDIQNVYDAWIVEHPEAIGDLQETAKVLAFFLSGRVSTTRKLFKIIDHLIKDDYNQASGTPDDSQELEKSPSKSLSDLDKGDKYTLKYIKKACDAFIVEHPKAIDSLKKIIIIGLPLAGAALSKVVLSQLIYQLMLDYNKRVITRARDAKKSSDSQQSKL
ncbi:uncharacterized protein [Drosophila kikkawai]|uniref:Uncharacterized protein n=1 Tax=Drosophila kikkawai TaxID=30033 RepID=A0A6P4IKK0_DROKI|nr:uncharacterized protein LOC108075231 [Drosophila kikkawai]